MNMCESNGLRWVCCGAMLLGVAYLAGADAHAASMAERIETILQEREADLIEVRRDLHRHPELAGEEVRTAAVIARRLESLGLKVRTGVGGHGVVGVLRGELPGPVVAYRADMDAMASTAPDPVDFASQTPGVRHICGHDMHVTVGLGIAEVLAANRAHLAGTVKFLFQPAEENAEGAKAMIADGALEDPSPEAIFAVHSAPLPTGQFGSRPGMMLPGLDIIKITLTGDGDLRAAAEACSNVIAGVSTTASLAPDHEKNDDPMDAAMDPGAFISAGALSSEPAGDGWTVSGMARASSEPMHARAKSGIEKGLAALELDSIEYKLVYMERAIAPVNNDADLVARADELFRSIGGEAAVLTLEETTPFFSEDFAFFQEVVPGALFFMGVSNEKENIVGMPHHPMFVADEAAIAVGVKNMSLVLVDFLENGVGGSDEP
ncbi:MAG: amidohydrolase [bacterium]|nr:amidohydrolase [bacterium]